MSETKTRAWTPPVSDAAVHSATGRDWEGWRAELDQWARALDHRDIAARLGRDFALAPWWSQMVAGSWEIMIGRRDPHQRSAKGGKYQASASKTVNAPPEAVEEAFSLSDFANWGPEGIFFKSSGTPGRSINGAWSECGRVSVWMTKKDEARTQITLSHDGLENSASCAIWKSEWRAALNRLKLRLED